MLLINIATVSLLLLFSCNASVPKVKDVASMHMAKEAALYNLPVLTAELVLYRDNRTVRCDCKNDCEKPVILGFRGGRLLSEENAPAMDSAGMYSYLEKLNHSQDSIFYIYRRLACPKYSSVDKKFESLYQGGIPLILRRGFTGFTMDDILWNDTMFMSSESPMSVFGNYRDIYPEVPFVFLDMFLPKSSDKNYVATWMLTNDMLYLNDIKFPYYEGDKKIVQSRFRVIEKLTGEKLQKIPSSYKQGIPARWYSGTLFFKRYPAENEFYLDCPYDCEPFYRVDFENGKVASIKRVKYMYFYPER